MPRKKKTSLAVAACIAMLPSLALAQAAVSSDQPITRSSDGPLLGTTPESRGTALDAPGSRSTPNALTGPGSPGTTGTGAAGTGPTGTMAAPGR